MNLQNNKKGFCEFVESLGLANSRELEVKSLQKRAKVVSGIKFLKGSHIKIHIFQDSHVEFEDVIGEEI